MAEFFDGIMLLFLFRTAKAKMIGLQKRQASFVRN